MVRAKFVCVDKEQQSQGGYLVQMLAVTHGSEENEKFFKYTPGGEVRLFIINEAAAEEIKEGKEYYVDFTPCE